MATPEFYEQPASLTYLNEKDKARYIKLYNWRAGVDQLRYLPNHQSPLTYAQVLPQYNAIFVREKDLKGPRCLDSRYCRTRGEMKELVAKNEGLAVAAAAATLLVCVDFWSHF
ncbi:hypothetical protein NHQ30_000733 [Ciborinia camelliae]|nr:hypothetical protein NHQ30_000733 [Ciborinia camelliae]